MSDQPHFSQDRTGGAVTVVDFAAERAKRAPVRFNRDAVLTTRHYHALFEAGYMTAEEYCTAIVRIEAGERP